MQLHVQPLLNGIYLGNTEMARNTLLCKKPKQLSSRVLGIVDNMADKLATNLMDKQFDKFGQNVRKQSNAKVAAKVNTVAGCL